jgi:hypothetical protein
VTNSIFLIFWVGGAQIPAVDAVEVLQMYETIKPGSTLNIPPDSSCQRLAGLSLRPSDQEEKADQKHPTRGILC